MTILPCWIVNIEIREHILVDAGEAVIFQCQTAPLTARYIDFGQVGDAGRNFSAQLIVSKMEGSEIDEIADSRWNRTAVRALAHIYLFQLCQIADTLRNGAGCAAIRYIEPCEIDQITDGIRNAACQINV